MQRKDIADRILLVILLFAFAVPAFAERPNVIVIMSDDQGVGDYGFMGNELIRTPSLDDLHSKSGFLSNFYVSNVCAPTRASLMTGRYNYRTRCIDTFLGRAMMDPDEITLAEYLGEAGYRTGIYGKWHLGDNYPMRPMDQGFEQSLVHRGGGIGQPSDPIDAEGKYSDPTLFRNGEEVKMKGYCTDIYFDGAMDFIESAASKGESFFTYIATNAPHGPFHDVPPGLLEEYKKVDFSSIIVGKRKPDRLESEFDKLARISAMITNIDENVGRLMQKLDDLKIRENTIVIYLNDNGPNSMRYVGNMRGMKTHVDNGGIRSPLVFHWPSKIRSDASSAQMCAHIDIVPTILDACGVDAKDSHKIDGRSFLPLLTGDETDWETRTLVFQTHRGNEPQPFHHFAIHEDDWKLVHPSGFGKESFEGEPKLELYNLGQDPKQQKNLASTHREVLERLTESYRTWFKDVSTTRENNFAPPRIVVGTEHEPTSVLTRQDWRHEGGVAWGKNSTGSWLINNPKEQMFDVEVVLTDSETEDLEAVVEAGSQRQVVPLKQGSRNGHLASMKLPAGNLTIRAQVMRSGNPVGGVHQLILKCSR